ncbi:MAG: hypothetical protein JXA57_19055 [Armatimonadetes bacterium]|nr:hypothetical protein [Armatimonadota bacterium]
MINLPGLLSADLLYSDQLRRATPAWVKASLKRRIPYAEYRSEQLRREAERRFGGSIPSESDYESPNGAVLGVFFDSGYTFAFNVAACRDLKVRFKVIDLLASDWVRRVVDSGCDAFLTAPPTLRSIWRRVYEERLWVVVHDLQRLTCPTFEELYLWESKRRMRDWLSAHNVPHPESWVFMDRAEAMDFCEQSAYPVVCKTDSGAASSGVFLLRDRRSAKHLVAQAFDRGLLARSADAREWEQGSLLFQQFVPHDFEWRVVRIGDDFMCRRKVRIGDHASGSGDIGWAAPLPGMLDFARDVTDIGGFRTMTLDLFQNTTVHRGPLYLVNELQAIAGFRDVPETENTGRWRLEGCPRAWQFEPGRFHQNACANLRVRMIIDTLDQAIK